MFSLSVYHLPADPYLPRHARPGPLARGAAALRTAARGRVAGRRPVPC